jgi:hypothetical protein
MEWKLAKLANHAIQQIPLSKHFKLLPMSMFMVFQFRLTFLRFHLRLLDSHSE